MLERAKKYLWIIKAISKLKLSTQKKVVTRFLTAKKKYLPDEKTNANVDNILKCALCPNMCRFDCPVLQVKKSETYSPSGKARIAYLLEMERFTSEDAVHLMYTCAGCDACRFWCHFDFSLEDLLKGVRKDLLEKGLNPSFVSQFRENLVRMRTVYEHGRTSLGLNRGHGDILYYAGCTTLNKMKKVARATLKILEKTNVNFTVLSEEWCCGAPLDILGYDKDFKEFAEHNSKIINEGEYKTLVCSCPTCVHIFKDIYPEMGFPLDVEILHTSQFLLQLAERNNLEFKTMTGEYVYHDPCALARRLNIYEEPRRLIRRIPGVTLKEPQFTKKETVCCGMGGMLGVINPEISSQIAQNRCSQLSEKGATVITSCPVCELAFRGGGFRALDISELVQKSLK